MHNTLVGKAEKKKLLERTWGKWEYHNHHHHHDYEGFGVFSVP